MHVWRVVLNSITNKILISISSMILSNTIILFVPNMLQMFNIHENICELAQTSDSDQ